MPLVLDVPGLTHAVPQVPDGSIVAVRGGLNPAKSFLAQRFRKVEGKTARPLALAQTQAPDAKASISAWSDVPKRCDVVVDSFSHLHVESAPGEVLAQVMELRRMCRKDGRVAVLVLDDGVMQERSEAAALSLCDGVIQMQVREDAEQLVDFLRLPRWPGLGASNHNIYYDFDGERLLVDTRRRVG